MKLYLKMIEKKQILNILDPVLQIQALNGTL